jgi:ABC-type sugar transport system substrate-binding protein
MSYSNLTTRPHLALHRRGFLHGAAALGVAGAFPAILSRSAFAAEDLPVPKKHYLIAFSNGDMNNSWRAAFVNSMEQWAGKFKAAGPGVDYVWTNSAGDSAKQLQDCQTLLAQKPNILILSPNQATPLDPVIDMATKANVPLIVIDRSLIRKPPVGTYFLNITQNYAFSGMTMAAYALDYLYRKHGAYKGNIVEIQGELGSSPNTDMYVGIREVLKHYPDIKILSTEEGKWSNDGGRRVMEGYIQRFSDDQMDVIFTYADASGLGAIQAIKAAGRNELLDGRFASKDGDVNFVQDVADGKAMVSTECPPYYGAFAIPEAIEYLNGDLKTTGIQYLKLRTWPNPAGPSLLPVSGADLKAILAQQIKYTEDHKLALIPPETGDYDQLYFDVSKVQGYSDVVDYSKSGEVPKDIYDLQNTK